MAGGDHCLGFDRLLVEVRACAATLVEAIATNGSETASLRLLNRNQPAQGFEPNLQRFFVGHPLAAEDERLAHACVIIGDAGFKPWPVLRGAFVPKLHKFSSQCLAHRVDVRITREVSKILVDTE